MKASGSKNLGFFSGTIADLEAMGYTRCGTCNAEAGDGNTSGDNTSGGNTSGDSTSGGNTSTGNGEIVTEEPASYDFVVNMNPNNKKVHDADCSNVSSVSNKGYYSGSLDDLLAMGYKTAGCCTGASGDSSGSTSGGNTSGGNTSTGSGEIVKTEPSSYDYAVNTNSKKIHHPTCRSVADMKASGSKNLGFFSGTIAELEAMGYTRCGTCNAEG